MTDEQAARLRELATESLSTVKGRFDLAMEGDAILALLDERDAAVALLRECREVLRDWTGPSTDYRAAMMALNRAVARIDALLGGEGA